MITGKYMKRKLTLWLHEGHEMADLREGNHSLHYGNYWDFHAGCMGTEIVFADGSVIDFADSWTGEIRRPHRMAQMVADKIGAELVIKIRKPPF